MLRNKIQREKNRKGEGGGFKINSQIGGQIDKLTIKQFESPPEIWLPRKQEKHKKEEERKERERENKGTDGGDMEIDWIDRLKWVRIGQTRWDKQG